MSLLTMTKSEREQFLAGLHVGVLSVAAPGGRAPLTVPVWYNYEPGGHVSVMTGRRSRKGEAILAAGRMSLCAQNENPPYQYVSVEGPVEADELDLDERLAIARRYLGLEGGDQWVAANPEGGDSVLFRMTPEHWLTADYGKASQ